MRQPSKLRYVECELPLEVEKALIELEDDLDLQLKDIDDRLDDFLKNDLPTIEKELDRQIAFREELVSGSLFKG